MEEAKVRSSLLYTPTTPRQIARPVRRISAETRSAARRDNTVLSYLHGGPVHRRPAGIDPRGRGTRLLPCLADHGRGIGGQRTAGILPGELPDDPAKPRRTEHDDGGADRR